MHACTLRICVCACTCKCLVEDVWMITPACTCMYMHVHACIEDMSMLGDWTIPFSDQSTSVLNKHTHK